MSSNSPDHIVAKTPLGWIIIGPAPTRDAAVKSSDTIQPRSLMVHRAHQTPVRKQHPKKRKKAVKPPKEDARPAIVLQTRNETPRIGGGTCIWHKQLNRSHAHSTAQCRHFRWTTPLNRWTAANKSRLCKTCLIDAHPLSQCPLKDQHKRCEKCEYTHGAAIGCCPLELRRIPPSPSNRNRPTSPMPQPTTAEQEPSQNGSRHQSQIQTPSEPAMKHEQPERTDPDRQSGITFSKDIWVYGSPLLMELAKTRSAQAPTQPKKSSPEPKQ